MAIKQSVANPPPKTTPQHQQKAMDPWGGSPPATQTPQNSFDPFNDASTSQPSAGLDAWGGIAANASNNVQTQDKKTWSPPKNAPLVLPPPQKVVAKPLDPWGPSTAPTVNKPQPQLQPQPQPQPSANPWGENFSAHDVSSSSAWNVQPQPTTGFPTSNGGSFDAFAPAATSGFESNESFDPLKEFDSLHISSTNPLAPTQSIPGTNVMVPISASENPNFMQHPANGFDINDNQAESGSNVTHKAGAFLGENAGLVNVENLVAKPKTATHYQTLSIDTSGALGSHRNPFNQKGPSLSLNQMKGGPQFSGQPPLVGQQVPMVNPTPMSMPPAGYGIVPNQMPMQPVYGMQPQMMNNPFTQPVNQMNAFPQQNPSLF